jgi:hypothetical protein
MSYLPPPTEALDSAHVTKELRFPLDFDDEMPCTAHDQDYRPLCNSLTAVRGVLETSFGTRLRGRLDSSGLTAGLPATSTLYNAIEGHTKLGLRSRLNSAT